VANKEHIYVILSCFMSTKVLCLKLAFKWYNSIIIVSILCIVFHNISTVCQLIIGYWPHVTVKNNSLISFFRISINFYLKLCKTAAKHKFVQISNDWDKNKSSKKLLSLPFPQINFKKSTLLAS
jgi:hypothetical protein